MIVIFFGDFCQDLYQVNLIFDDYANDQVNHHMEVANKSWNTKIDGGSQVHRDLPKPGLLLRPDGASSEKVVPSLFHSSSKKGNFNPLFFSIFTDLEKRLLLRKLLDSTIGRIIELKHELVNLDFIEYSFIDDVLAEMKVKRQWQR